MKELSELRILEGSIQPSACSTGTAKSELLSILDIVRTLTDKSHGLTAQEIAGIIGLRTGKAPTEGKVLSDLNEIAANRPLGIEISVPAKGKNDGFRCTSSALSTSQVRLLVNMVRTCKFITAGDRLTLCNSLYELVSINEQDSIVDDVCIDRRETSGETEVFHAADVTSKAMREKRRIRFSYVVQGLDGRNRLMNAPDGTKVFEETPIRLIFSFGNYYLETWGEYEQGKWAKLNRRLDKMRDPSVSSKRAQDTRTVRELRRTVEERTSQVFDMWGDGTPRVLFLRVCERAAGYFRDRFGANARISHIAEDGSSGCACVVVQLSPTFYRWLFGMRTAIALERPKSIDWLEPYWDDMADRFKGYDSLLEDYRAAKAGYRKMLAEALESLDGWQGDGDATDQEREKPDQ
ncbi:WYL domain-containing protein [Enorma massiliensis]|uniref:WYL domain-containing protein n=1 Tax=Enorma massiliensis TaxID=1472761 RepID=UPI003AF152E5